MVQESTTVIKGLQITIDNIIAEQLVCNAMHDSMPPQIITVHIYIHATRREWESKYQMDIWTCIIMPKVLLHKEQT